MGLFDSLSSHRANKESKKVKKDIALREQRQLGEMSPENIQKLIQMFMTKYGQLLAPQMMQAQQTLGARSSGVNLAGAGLTRSLKAGLPAQFGKMQLEAAIPEAMDVATKRAGIIGGTPIPYMPKKSGFADVMSMIGNYYGVQSPEDKNTGGGGVF